MFSIRNLNDEILLKQEIMQTHETMLSQFVSFILFSFKSREMMLQTVEIIGGAKTYCDRLDITIDFNSGAVGDKFSMMCRRQPIDFCDVSFNFGASEEVISDVITYRVQRKGRKTLCIFTVPIYCKPLSTEEVILKSNEGHALIVSKVFEKDKVRNWFAY